jgi:hypothetical protein
MTADLLDAPCACSAQRRPYELPHDGDCAWRPMTAAAPPDAMAARVDAAIEAARDERATMGPAKSHPRDGSTVVVQPDGSPEALAGYVSSVLAKAPKSNGTPAPFAAVQPVPMPAVEVDDSRGCQSHDGNGARCVLGAGHGAAHKNDLGTWPIGGSGYHSEAARADRLQRDLVAVVARAEAAERERDTARKVLDAVSFDLGATERKLEELTVAAREECRWRGASGLPKLRAVLDRQQREAARESPTRPSSPTAPNATRLASSTRPAARDGASRCKARSRRRMSCACAATPTFITMTAPPWSSSTRVSRATLRRPRW